VSTTQLRQLVKKLVLVVDDDDSVRTLIVRALAARGYDTLEACDGLSAAEMLGRMARSPDLLICDVMMPTVDGFSLARLVKTSPALRSVPIIFLTAKTAAQDVVQGIKLGARHYVQKPFSVKDLLDKVEKTIR
jgi:two-component system OmpR family response regulator